MRKSGAKKGFVIFFVVLLMIAGALSAGYFVTKKLIFTNYEIRIGELETQVNSNTHNVFVAASEIKMGEEITMDKLRVESHLLTQTAGLFLDDSIGTKALVDIPAGAVMYAAYGSSREDESTSRMVEYTCMYLSATLKKGDYVDVRIRYQNGEDFALLSKKQIEEISIVTTSCHLVVNEKELQMMASAIIDANEFDAVIYCVKYTAPSVQEATVVTYPARSEILSVLYDTTSEDYQNLMKRRGELEERLLALNEVVERPPINISNFSEDRGKEQSNTNDTGVSSTPVTDVENEAAAE